MLHASGGAWRPGMAIAPPTELALVSACADVDLQPPWQGGARVAGGGSEIRAWGPKFASQTLGFMGAAHEWRWPRRLTSAPASVDTVAAFRPWRGFRPSVARGRRGHHRRASTTLVWNCEACASPGRGIHSAHPCAFPADARASAFSGARHAARTPTSPLRAASPCGPAILPIRRTRGGSHPPLRRFALRRRCFGGREFLKLAERGGSDRLQP